MKLDMKAVKRLNPTPNTIKLLLAKSGNQCYFSGCTHEIVNEQGILVAECCHIEAAMPKGERFNPNQTEEERRNIENLLFLCHKHHVETDIVEAYTVDKLKEIKYNHENLTQQKKLDVKDEYIQQVLAQIENIGNSISRTEENTNQILEQLLPSSISKFESTDFLKHTKQVDNYIPRKLLYENRDDILIYGYKGFIYLSKDKPVRALIIADGGEGKTVFMSYLGNDSMNHNIYPVFVSLKDYIAQSQPLQAYIENQYSDLSKIDKKDYKAICFFLDGFDEIGDSGNAVKQINHFCNSHTEANIVLSSRRNSYTNEFPDFQKYILADLDNQDIKEYIRKYLGQDINTDEFFIQVYHNGFSNILHNPFYLNILIDSYVKHGYSLQNISKKDLICDLLEKRIELDKIHSPHLQIDKPNHKSQIERYAKELAFTMALMGKRSLTQDELTSIISNDDFDLVVQTLPIKKGNIIENVQHWEFEHNIFLEHFSALVLEKLPFEKITEYTTSLSKVKTEWRDIFIHLLGILDKTDNLFSLLTNWLFDNDIEIFYKVEKEQIDQSKREVIFRKIFSWYKEKCIWIDSFKVNITDLASFGESRNNIYYIFDEICDSNNYQQVRVNAAKIFEKFKMDGCSYEEKQVLCEKYLEVIKSISPQLDYLLEQLIDAFPSKEIKLLDELITTFKDTDFVRIRTSLFYIIRDNKLEDRYIDFYLDAYSKSDMLPDGAHYGLYDENINQALCNTKEPSSYVKIFNYLQKEYNLEYFIQQRLTVFNKVVSNGGIYYNNDVFDSFYCLFKTYLKNCHDNKDYFIPFFDKTQTREKAIRKSLEEIKTENQDYKYIHVTAILWLLKDEYLPILLNSTLDEGSFVSLYYRLEKANLLAEKIKIYLEDKFQFVEPKRIDWNSIWEQRRKEEFDILFDKEWFCRESLAAFHYFESDTIEREQLYNFALRDRDFHINNSVSVFLRVFEKENIISKEKVSNWINKKTTGLDAYLNQRILISLRSSQDIEQKLSKEQRLHIVNWYNMIMPKVDFKNAFVREKEDRVTLDDIAYDVIFYIQKLNLSCPDEILCEMLHLPSIYPYKVDFRYLVNKIKDKKTLNEKIMQNIREFYLIMYGEVLYPHLDYAFEHKLDAIYPTLISMLQDKSWNDIHKKSYIINKWIENGLDDNLLISVMSSLPQYLQLELSRNLYKKKQVVLTKDFIDAIINNPEEDKNWLMAISVLVMMKDLRGLQLGINWLKKNLDKTYGFVETQTSYTFPSSLSLSYEKIEALPYLFELLELSYKIKEDQFNYESIRNICYDNITKIGLISEDFFKQTTKFYKQYIEDKKNIFKSNVASLNYYLEDMKSKYWNNSYKPYSFRQARQINKEIYTDYIN